MTQPHTDDRISPGKINLMRVIHDAEGNLIVHYNDVIMGTMASQITSLTIVYSTVSSGADLRKHQGSASLAFVRGIHRSQVNSPHKGPVTRKMFPFDDVIMSANSTLPGQSFCNRPWSMVLPTTCFAGPNLKDSFVDRQSKSCQMQL